MKKKIEVITSTEKQNKALTKLKSINWVDILVRTLKTFAVAFIGVLGANTTWDKATIILALTTGGTAVLNLILELLKGGK